MKMRTFAVLVLVSGLVFLSSGCTEQKDLKTLLEEESEYWKFLLIQGISTTQTAKEYTLIYVALVEKNEDNPIDALVQLRYEHGDKGLGEIMEVLQENGFTKDEAVFLSLPLTGDDAEWNVYMGNMVAIDDYIQNRMGYEGIPLRKSEMDKTYNLKQEPESSGPSRH